jgi:hypothetical protein
MSLPERPVRTHRAGLSFSGMRVTPGDDALAPAVFDNAHAVGPNFNCISYRLK